MSDSRLGSYDPGDTRPENPASAGPEGAVPIAEGFAPALLRWYDVHRRDLPWRAKRGETPDPYRVWLSEIMLQQTTVKAVAPYYSAFLSRWPTVNQLAAAPIEDVLAAWAGLGYYSRARNLHACAVQLAKAGIPETEAGWRAMPGVGPYTAAAITAIAFGKRATAVDGNVERVISRVFAIDVPLPKAKRLIYDAAVRLTPPERPGDYAQAMMDLGATVCTPKSPSCLICPVRAFCSARQEGDPARYPVKSAKVAKPVRSGCACVVVWDTGELAHVLLRRRASSGLLGGMLEPLMSEWVAHDGVNAPHLERDLRREVERRFRLAIGTAGGEIKHTFTHFELRLQVFTIRLDNNVAPLKEEERWVPVTALGQAALPTVMRKAVETGLRALPNQTAVSGTVEASKRSSVSTVE
jgi:A/G-specific adenine glycosylase